MMTPSASSTLFNLSPEDAVLLADGLRQQLRYHHQLGISSYPSSEFLRKFLALQPQLTSTTLFENERGDGRQTPQQLAAENSDKESVEARQEGAAGSPYLQNRLCWRLEEGDAPLRLLLVGDKVRGTGDQLFFGCQEDEMVRKMMAALGLPGSQVGIINVIADDAIEEKVTPALTAQYGKQLFLQITALAPECICTMGSMAAKTLLQTTKPLSLLRGRFHRCPPEEYQCPVLVTYHPFFLLNNPEMKKPTWADLQFLGRHMGLLP